MKRLTGLLVLLLAVATPASAFDHKRGHKRPPATVQPPPAAAPQPSVVVTPQGKHRDRHLRGLLAAGAVAGVIYLVVYSSGDDRQAQQEELAAEADGDTLLLRYERRF